MKIFLSQIYVNDQEKALRFYTEKLGFVKKEDFTNGGYRWLTVVSPDDREGASLLLDLNAAPFAKAYQQALFEQGVPATILQVADLQGEYKRLSGMGVEFSTPPMQAGPASIAVFNDTCGNLIQLKG